MNNYEVYDYIQRLHCFVESQDTKIKHLEKLVQSLINDINELKCKPSIQVEKIEYKFDQLKVETLEGTLNIGFNPTDLQGIEDFEIEGKQMGGDQNVPGIQVQSTLRVEEHILQNIETDVDTIIQQFEHEKQVKIEESYINFIKEDIRKQLPTRIQHYLNQIPINQRNTEQSIVHENRVIQQIKKDIQNGIYVFLNNLPKEMNGKEGTL
jgi:spore germination protein PC